MSQPIPTTSDTDGKRTSWTKRLRRWLLAGIILLAPAYVTYGALKWIFEHVDRPLRLLVARWLGYNVPGVGFLSVLLILVVTGAVASTFVMRSFLKWLEATLDRIPLVRTLYSGVKQLVSPLGEDQSTSFQRVVMIPFPHEHMFSLGFLIKQNAATSPTGEPLSAVLVPTNHLHLGNVVLCPNTLIHDVDMNAESALRFLVSMGAALDRPLKLSPPRAEPAKQPG